MMTFSRCIFGAAAAALCLGAAQAAPLPVATMPGGHEAGLQTVQFFDDDPPPPRRYYGPGPGSRYAPQPRQDYYPPPQPRGYRAPPPPGYGYGYVGKEAMKDYVKGQRQMQKDMQKERVRAWNKTHGF